MAAVQEGLADTALKNPAVEVVAVSLKEELAAPPLSHSEADLIEEHVDSAFSASDGDDSDGVESEASDIEEHEENSLYVDILDDSSDEMFDDEDPDICTPEEGLIYRTLLKTIGAKEFIQKTIATRTVTAKRLCSAFGIRPLKLLRDEPDNAYYDLLGLAIRKELCKRVKLLQYNTIDDAVSLLTSSKNIILLTGAGISTSLGIPDFRSKHTGFYATLENLGLTDPQEVFDIRIFRQDPGIFYSVAKDILPLTSKYSPTHGFIRLLQDKGKLMTNYTQNIDNLEGHAGIDPERLIQCHGSFAQATCQTCRIKVEGREIFEDIKSGRVARCTRCIAILSEAQGTTLKRKRNSAGRTQSKSRKREDYEDSTDEETPEEEQIGIMKPDITFFGEELPSSFGERLIKHDIELVDLVVVIGTSLKVAPVSEIVNAVPPHVPQIYISRDPCNHVDFDITLLGDCDVVVAELCKRAGWELKHDMIPEAQQIEVTAQGPTDSVWSVKALAA